jgi:hypothetical protein
MHGRVQQLHRINWHFDASKDGKPAAKCANSGPSQPDSAAIKDDAPATGNSHSGQRDTDAKHSRKEEEKLGRDSQHQLSSEIGGRGQAVLSR